MQVATSAGIRRCRPEVKFRVPLTRIGLPGAIASFAWLPPAAAVMTAAAAVTYW